MLNQKNNKNNKTMKATPITSALKRKYSPLKNEDSKAQQESKKMLADETGVYVQNETIIPGEPGTAGTELPSYKEAWDQDIDGIRTGKGYGGKFENYFADMTGIKPGDERDIEREEARAKAAEGTPGTPDTKQTSEVKLKTKVEGTSMTPENLRRQIRKGKIAANQEKRATSQAARTQAKLDKLEAAGDTSSPKYKRLTAKLKQKNQLAKLAGEAGKNVQRQTEEGTGLGGSFVKGERDTMQSEVDNQESLEERETETVAKMKFSPAKFKSYGKKSPLKKLTDLSGDGKVTKKDVLIGRGVISKDGSPAKMGYGNKKSPFKMGGYGKKTYK